MRKTLILGYGNADRQDDGVAWQVLVGLAQRFGRLASGEPEDGFDIIGAELEFQYALQLVPEMAELVAGFDRVCFVDAHTAAIDEDLQRITLQAVYQNSPFTHHMTPETLLSFCLTLYKKVPEAILVSIRGYEFGFSRQLSGETQALAEQAIQEIWNWYQAG